MSLPTNIAINSQKKSPANTLPSLNAKQQKKLRGLLEQGLPTCSRPYLTLARAIDLAESAFNEQQVIEQIKLWQQQGLIRRFGLVVKHRKLGYNANAMVVWNVADIEVDGIAKQLSQCPEVSLCYRRPRRLPDWPYNLFCMIHGTERAKVLAQLQAITNRLNLSHIEKEVLFSNRAFKQQGARYG